MLLQDYAIIKLKILHRDCDNDLKGSVASLKNGGHFDSHLECHGGNHAFHKQYRPTFGIILPNFNELFF